MQIGAGAAKFAHAAQHGDAPIGGFAAKLLQGCGHRQGIGIIAFVDQQRFAAGDRQDAPLAPARKPGHFRERQASGGKVAAHRLDRGEHGERIRYPVIARRSDGEA